MNEIFELLDLINNRLANLENNLMRVEEKLDLSLAIQRSHLVRIKNKEELPDSMILLGRPYNDLSPEQAIRIYNNQDLDFIVLDVSKNEVKDSGFEAAVRITLEELPSRLGSIRSKTTPILVISERGVRSIQACEVLVKNGFYNVNNISGGHLHWPENQTLSAPNSV